LTKQAQPRLLGDSLCKANAFCVGTTGRRDTRATTAGQLLIELSTGTKLSPTVRSENWPDSMFL
jgi:hypothetical protein